MHQDFLGPIGFHRFAYRARDIPSEARSVCTVIHRNTRHHPFGGTQCLLLSAPVFAGLRGRSTITGDGMWNAAGALPTNPEQILSLPDETIICPGHVPLTTVGEEKLHNPFFAEQ